MARRNPPLLATLHSGAVVLAKMHKGRPYPYTYANTTQAQKKLDETIALYGNENCDWGLWRGRGRPLFIRCFAKAQNPQDTFAKDHPIVDEYGTFYSHAGAEPFGAKARYAVRWELERLARESDSYGKVARRILRDHPYPAFSKGTATGYEIPSHLRRKNPTMTPEQLRADMTYFAREYGGWNSYDANEPRHVAAVKHLASEGVVELDAAHHRYRIAKHPTGPEHRIAVRVTTAGGESWVTGINTDLAGAKAYFLGQRHQSSEKSPIDPVVKVEHVKSNPRRRHRVSPGNAASRLAWWRWHNNPKLTLASISKKTGISVAKLRKCIKLGMRRKNPGTPAPEDVAQMIDGLTNWIENTQPLITEARRINAKRRAGTTWLAGGQALVQRAWRELARAEPDFADTYGRTVPGRFWRYMDNLFDGLSDES